MSPKWFLPALRRAAAALAMSMPLLPNAALAQQLNPDFWVTNGTVWATAVSGGTLYVGGTFTYVGPPTGGGAPLAASSGVPLPDLPRVHGTVRAIASDGSGGWFVGGIFDSVGGVARAHLAHVRSDLTVAPWAPNPNNPVFALAVDGATVYAGGQFSTIGGQSRANIAALDAGTGLATSWNPGSDNFVFALAVSGPTVYVGGSFTFIGGQLRGRLAALDAVTGLATSWDPGADAVVRAIVLDGANAYVGGAFTNAGGQARNRIAAVDLGTGAATPWDPNASGNVYALAVSGSVVYAGGAFATIGGEARGRIAALDAVTGLATAWNPNASHDVNGLGVSGSTVYACGAFITIGGQARRYVAALDATSGLATAWSPHANNSANALLVSGSTVYVGGTFTSVGGVLRTYLAALDVATGAATAWNPVLDGIVYALAVSGSTVYAGGNFSLAGGQSRLNAAALDATTGLATAWNPNANDYVYALAVSGSTVYAGGAFFNIGGVPRNRIAALDAGSGAATLWNPNANGVVQALAVSGSTVYAGGGFNMIGGQTRNRIAALDAASGLATAWNPDASAVVNALALSGPTLYVGGAFTSIGGQLRGRIAALDATTGLATGWNPNANNTLNALAVNGSTVYAGGLFSSIGGETRQHFASLDATSGLATGANLNGNNYVHAIAATGSTAYVGGLFTVLGGRDVQGLAAVTALLGVSALHPTRGGDTGEVTVTFHGVGIASGATARLSRAGEPDVTATQVVVAADGRSLTGVFDLAGRAHGAWDAIVTNPDLEFAELPAAFEVEGAAPHQLRVDIVGPALIRPDRRRSFDVVIENLGNVDVAGASLWISRLPAGATLELDFPLASPASEGGEPDWSAAPLTLAGPGGRYTTLVIPRLPPGTTVRRIHVTVPLSVSTFELDAALAPPWSDADRLAGCLAGAGVIGAASCAAAQLTSIHQALATTPGVMALSGIGLWAKVAWQCEGASSLGAALAEAEEALDLMLQAVEQTGMPPGCEVALTPRWQSRRHVTVVTSLDPNEKLGPIGVGPSRLIGKDQVLPYSIRFENLETASAPAQEVVVVDALDAAQLDLGTLSLGPITFGSRTVYPPPGLSRYATEVDLRPGLDLLVAIGVSLDVATGVLTWSFSSVDPATGAAPEDPLAGFLPPNLTPPEGEGSVLFTVMPKSGLAGGAGLSNRATILFDGVPLETPEWSNTLHTSAPESSVQPLGATQDSASFTVQWSASGMPPDLHDYSVYVSEDGGAFRPWRLHVKATADTFAAPGGHTYAFYSLARDSSGNLEPAPAEPDAQTYSRVAVESEGRLRLTLEGAVPNPATAGARVWFTLPSRERAVLEMMDVAGRRVWRQEVGRLGPGRHSIDVGAGARPAGLYFLRLSQGGETLGARIAVIR